MLSTLASQIKSIIKGEVDDSAAMLERYATDASLFYVKPSLVVFPQDTEDVKALVRFAAAQKAQGRNLSLTARSAGTDMGGGPLTESIVVSFTKHMNHLLELGEDYAIVEPGMYYRDFEKETLKKDLLLPSYPASRELCAMGGIVNNNSGGEKTLRWGKTERYAEKIWMVLQDGNEYEFSKLTRQELQQKMALATFEGQIYRQMSQLIQSNLPEISQAKPDVTKNSSGYALWNVYDKETDTFDLAKLMVGAQGTLGLMTKAKIKLVHPAKASKLLIMFLKDFAPLAEISRVVLPMEPESFEVYDDNTFKLAIKFFPEILRQIKTGAFRLVLKTFPELWMMAKGGLPKLVLLAEFSESTEAEALQKAQAAKEALQKTLGSKVELRVTQSKEEEDEFWTIRRDSFNLLRKHLRGLRTAPFIDDFSVRAEKLPQFLPRLYQVMGRYKLIYTIAGHLGDGNFHIIPLMNPKDPETKRIIKTLSQEVYGLVLEFDGTITSEHNDGLVRTPFLPQMYGEKICGLFLQTKQIFDPLGIFNPGKKVPSANGAGTFAYAEKHINTKM